MAKDQAEEGDTRPLLCDPEEGRRVFFLHIPKTAGSSNNIFLRSLFGEDGFQDHVENLLPRLLEGELPPLRQRCISGHVPLWAWSLYRGTHVYERITLLRDPWRRLVSHVNWVNQFNHGVRMPSHGPGAQSLANVARALEQTDFEDRKSLKRLFDIANAQPYFSSFDNYQVRMLRTGRMDAMEKEMSPKDVEVASEELSRFLAFGFCEDQLAFQQDVITKLEVEGTPSEVAANKGSHKALVVSNSLARDVFAPWIEADSVLYAYARRLKLSQKTGRA